MKRFRSILCASLITIALSSSALAGDISIGAPLVAGDISIGKAPVIDGDISTGKAGVISIGSAIYLDFAGYLLGLLSAG